MKFPDKVKTTLNSIVTWAVAASLAITVVMSEVQSAGWLPDNWVGPIVQWGAIAVGVLGSVVTVIKRVMPVPEEGLQVLTSDGEQYVDLGDDDTLDVVRGWD